MAAFLYLYDCKQSRSINARRVAFTKELYGYTYSWNTKSGLKEKKKPGLIDQCVGSRAVADSAILVPQECKGIFDALFDLYDDILDAKIFEVLEEVQR
ncbi:MAG: hypothetical protein RTU30_07370 [Candidatus Thorarchaeota archaeon]